MLLKINIVLLVLLAAVGPAVAQSQQPTGAVDDRAALVDRIQRLETQLQTVGKAVDDLLWFQRVGDLADIDKITYIGPPNPKGVEIYGIKNERHPLKVYAYVFVPKKVERGTKSPLLILPHGGVHADFGTYHVHIVREMIEQGYIVVAPEYRGSTGYGSEFYKAIDYGGLEVDDVVAARDWAVENLPLADATRVGIVGWSHGGLISLLSVFNHPDKFQVAYAGVPVSDLVARMGYSDDSYRKEFSAKYHLGKTAHEDVEQYRKRSPAWQAGKLKTPLLIHTTTNDRDVNVIEVEHLIKALKAEGKDFQYKVYQDAPGGHSFNRIDTPLARESRQEIYAFLAKYLKGGSQTGQTKR